MKITHLNQRACGNCQLCCEVMTVEILNKGPHTKCANQCASGCAIYSTRPQSCREFSCVWLLEGSRKKEQRIFHDDERPDKIGAVPCISESKHGLAISMHLHDQHDVRRTVNRIAKKLPVILCYRTAKRTIFGPERLVAPFRRVLEIANARLELNLEEKSN